MSKDGYIKVTNQLKQVILNSKDPEAAAEQIYEMIEHYKKEYAKAKSTVPPESVAYTFNNMIQSFMDNLLKDPAVKVSCKSGCSFCCYQNVDITEDEAKLILMYCKDKGINIDWDKLVTQLPGHSNIKYQDRRCVFLGEGDLCTIYEHRPHMCRKYYVGSPAEDCNSEIEPEGGVVVMSANYAEVISNAILESTLSGSMAQMLIKFK